MATSKTYRIVLAFLAIVMMQGCTDLDDTLKLVTAEDVIVKDSDLYQTLQKITTAAEDPLQEITCIDFIYPITLQIYNTDLQVIGVVTIGGDEDFSTFLGDLAADQAISISYPIATTLEDGTEFSVTNNTELKIAIDNCSREDIIAYASSLFGENPVCVWTVPYFKDAENKYAGGVFNSNEDGTLTFSFEGETYNGTWIFLYVGDEFHMNINLEGDSEVATDWNIDRPVQFDGDKIIITNTPTDFVLQQKCETGETYAIGDSGPAGGIVFYDKGSYSLGWRYMEISTTDLGFFEWGCLGSDIPNTMGITVGDGLPNSAAVADFHDNLDDYYLNPAVCNVLNNGTVAAEKALLFEMTGFETVDDWFLPSQEELLLVYQNLHVAAFGNFTADQYWTSTAVDADNAIAIHFADGSIQTVSKIPTANTVRTRAIRRF